MTLMRSRETHARKVIFLLVFLSHCALILIISRWSSTQKSAAQIPHEPLFVFFLHSIKAKTEGDVAKEPSPANARPVLKRPNTPAPNDLSNPTGADATPSNAIIDWYAEAHSVAEEALEKDPSKTAKRAFEHKMPPRPTAAPDTARQSTQDARLQGAAQRRRRFNVQGSDSRLSENVAGTEEALMLGVRRYKTTTHRTRSSCRPLGIMDDTIDRNALTNC
jgi:type IV secretory pathway VirB10-like protein